MEATRYQFLGCGLDNVHLINGYEFRRTRSGRDVIWIEDITGLHRVLALHLCDLLRPLTPKEFRYLRKQLDLSQREVAGMTGLSEEIVQAIERPGVAPLEPIHLKLVFREGEWWIDGGASGARIP